MYNVTVLTPRGRRQQVKVTPNTTLLQILEEVCTKHGFNPQEYDLRHHNKVMDISAMFRFTNLPNNAQLEMTEAKKQRQDSPVTLGVQLESGDRLTGVFSPSDTFWHAIVTLRPEEEKSNNLVVIYMRQELYGKEKLKSTTLRSLGLTGGRAMVRLLHKSPEELHTQANVSSDLQPRASVSEEKPSKEPSKPVEKPVQPPEPPPRPKTQPPEPVKKETKSPKFSRPDFFTTSGNIFQKLLKDEKTKKSLLEESKRGSGFSSSGKDSLSEDITVKSIPESKKSEMNQATSPTKDERRKSEVQQRPSPSKDAMEVDENDQEERKVHLLGDRNAVAYNLNSVKPVIFEEPEDFFDLTVSDAKMLLQQAKQMCVDLEDAPLMTSAQRELEKDKKVLSLLNQHKKTVLRIKFLDRTVLQGTFSPLETVSAVEKFVSGYLENPNLPFYLYTTPPKVVLKSEERLIECGCVPCAILYFGLKSGAQPPSQYLKSEVLEKLSTPSAAALTAFESRRMGNRSPEKKAEEAEKEKWSKEQNNSDAGPSGNSQWDDKPKDFKVPKWFRANK